MSFVEQFAADLSRKAETIEREKNGKALTQAEVDALKADAFMRKIAPYLYDDGGGK